MPYYATDPNNPVPSGIVSAPNSLDPCDGWSVPQDDGNGPQIGPIKPGQVVWLAFNNIPNPTRKKHFKLELKALNGSVGRVTITDADGFADANAGVAIGGTPTGNINNEHSATTIRSHYRFKQQPRWERFRLVNNSKNPVTFTVAGWSICGNYTGAWDMLLVERGSFGGEGIMRSYEPVIEVHCFPESVDLNPGILPVMDSQPPGSGPWGSQIISVDPEGEARPHGGVRFFSMGAGITPGDLFDLAFWMSFGPDEEKDVRYFIYTLDVSGTWEKYVIDLTDQLCDDEIIDGDINKDCRVGFFDFAEMAHNWLRCNDPEDPTCVPVDNDGDGWDSTVDCDDNNAQMNPGRAERCVGGFDEDCDGLVDGEDPDCRECIDGQSRPCENQSGVCSGSNQLCVGGMWQECDYAALSPHYEPEEMTCDGLDNDCDGVIDEDDPLIGTPCDGPDSDLCQEGTRQCISGALMCSDNTGNTVDLCNGLDDDCDAASPDGSEDPQTGTSCDGPDSDLCIEGQRQCIAGALSCSDNTGSTLDLCNGLDDDCDVASPDGSEDPQTGTACDGADSDLCKEGQRQCSAGALMCTDNTGSTVDLCNGLDDDCDLASADGSEDPQIGTACDGADSDLCIEGVRQCVAGALSCTDSTGSTVDLCNGFDDDCDPASADGSEDPQIGTACDGADSDLCKEGVRQCVAGALSCTDSTGSTFDLCNGTDDDCDPASVDGSEDPMIGIPCDGPDSDMCIEGTYQCVAGSQTCSDKTGDNVEVCDGIDNDCDGVTDEGCQP